MDLGRREAPMSKGGWVLFLLPFGEGPQRGLGLALLWVAGHVAGGRPCLPAVSPVSGDRCGPAYPPDLQAPTSVLGRRAPVGPWLLPLCREQLFPALSTSPQPAQAVGCWVATCSFRFQGPGCRHVKCGCLVKMSCKSRTHLILRTKCVQHLINTFVYGLS